MPNFRLQIERVLKIELNKDNFYAFLAHLSRRLIGELIVYPWSGVRRRPSYVVRPSVVHNAQTSSSQKPLGRSKPNFMWSLLGKGEQNFVRGIWVT